MPSSDRPSKNQRRSAARERARQAMAAQKRREARGRFFVRSGILAGVIAAAAVVTLVVVTGVQPSGPGPRNMASDGIVVGKNYKAVRSAAVAGGREPVPTKTSRDTSSVTIRMYSDFLCPNCGAFEKQNGDYIDDLVQSGAATIEYHPIAILDRASRGTKYSTRSANAAACVANYSPDSYFVVNRALIEAQPAENTEGLSDERLKTLVTGVEGLTNAKSIRTCIDDRAFGGWVLDATKRVTANVMQGSDATAFKGTPTVIVDGKVYSGENQTFKEFVTAALGEHAAR